VFAPNRHRRCIPGLKQDRKSRLKKSYQRRSIQVIATRLIAKPPPTIHFKAAGKKK